ncbi:MAG: hypothetical protein IJZ35_02685 [Clostridia bacterium]|nr:hypothetical protein [Clostridia bacterium]
MKGIERKLKADMAVLTKAYRDGLKNRNSCCDWLTDNYYIIERHYSGAIKDAKRLKFKNPQAPVVCEKICKNGILPPDDGIIAVLLNEKLSTVEIENLALFLKAELIGKAAESVGNDDETLENSIKSLIRIDETDFSFILYESCITEKLLCQDPAGLYRGMTEHTKEMYRHAVYEASLKNGKSEEETAVEALDKAIQDNRHIGFYLDFKSKNNTPGRFMLLFEALLPLAVSALIAFVLKAWYLLPLLYFPLWEALKFITDFIISKTAKTELLPSMDYSRQIPQSEKTVIAISTLLPQASKAKNMTDHLRKLFLSNCKDNTVICILADLTEAKTPDSPNDTTDINAMKRVADELNKKYSNKFVLAIRSRRFSVTENAYTAHERKRGAITSLVKLIKGDSHDFSTLHGDAKSLSDAKYIMALDSDTKMPVGTLNTLVGIASHPFNRPVISPSKQRVTKGYGIISPRVETGVESANKTHFSFVFSPSNGLSAYSHTVCERYQDLFGKSIFSGKGLIDVNAYYRLLPDRFPEEQILSHDILEGIVLRNAFAGNVALTDSFPSNENSYFKRLHRWIRGDMQNIQLLFDERYKSAFDTLGKWWLFDNIRRAVTPVIAVICIICAFFMPENAATAATLTALLSVSASHFFAFIHSLIHGGISIISRLYFSNTIPYAIACILRAFTSTVTLVRYAVCSADALIRALYRMLISRRHMLEWTTAADSESTNTPLSLAKKSVYPAMFGIILLIFGNTAMKIAGILFIIDLPFSILSAKDKKHFKPQLNEKERKKLSEYVSSMWRFYEKFNTFEHNYLIPDNVQFSPVYAVADRTSPTNIGLMLCVFLAARDFDFIDSYSLYCMLTHSLDTIEKLEKYKGNLYNWYGTKTLEVLNPRFISTVDSGNFLCCLVALRNGLETYTGECPELSDIIGRINALINACELDFLYSNQRNLFHIGYDVQNQMLTSSFFDLLMSEARMTSYFAVASGKVPVKHWEALGRTLSKSGRYAGPVSWSGTMFEYFMPAIFLPSYQNTMGSEALKFCIHCQKKRVKGQNIPYGISESCYYAFDSNLNYSYKAHGVKWLSLRNDRNKETVISPYSTFLTLYENPHSAMKNLKKIEKYGAVGEYGFIEAIDFTPSRCNNREFCAVNSFMSHHIGMSFLAAANCLSDNIFARRFITDDMMYGSQELLLEKIPADAKISKNIRTQEVPSLHDRFKNSKTINENIFATTPNSVIFSNGKWTLFAADTGCNISAYGNTSVFKCRKEPLNYPDGIFAAIKYNGKTILPFSDAPTYKSNPHVSVQLTDTSIRYKNQDDSFICTQTVTVHPTAACQLNSFQIQNRTKSKKRVTLMIYGEPLLKKMNEPDTHPAFSNMFIETEFIKDEKALIFTRKTDCKDNQLYIALGFHSKAEFEFSTDREQVLSSDTGIFDVFGNDFNSDSVSVDKCIALQLHFNLSAFSSHTRTLIMCAGQSKEEALGVLIKSRTAAVPSTAKCAPSVFAESSIEGIYAKKICERFLFGRSLPAEAVKASKINEGSRKDLWSTGISGDFPIVLVRCKKDDPTPVLPFVSLHGKLKNTSLLTELVFITDAPDGYTNKLKEAVMQAVTDSSVINKRAGIFILSINSLTRNGLSALTTAATVVYPENETDNADKKYVFSPLQPSEHSTDRNMFVKNGYIIGESTHLPWCHILSNRNFGTLISNTSLGYSWALNSRENKLSPWHNDTRRVINGEILFFRTDSGRYDLIKGSCAFFKNGKGEYYAVADGLNIRTCITVEGENLNKAVDVCIINDTDRERDVSLCYYWEPALGDFPQKQLFIKKEIGADRIILKNMYNDVFDGYTVLSCDRECTFSFDKASFLSNGASETDRNDCVIAKRRLHIQPKSSANVRFCLSYGKGIFSAVKMPYLRPKKVNENKIIIETPDKKLNDFFNDFLPNQIIGGRIFARTGFYQCSGAFGFRDQLQDAMAVAVTHPEILKTQILRCCAAQFVEGDVLHWFHQLYFGSRRFLRGVRTLYSDDLLWLPLAVSEYCRVSGDASILNLPVPYLSTPVLEKGETERFGEFTKSKHIASVYNHCINAITHACKFGEHSLALIKGGDWNDSFNEVGIGGKGESVWLTMFLSYTLKNFASLCNIKGDNNTADTMRKLSKKLLEAIDAHAWDNDRYLRCFYDDGTPMGAKGNSECAIDLLPQSWSVIAGMPDKDRCSTAVNTAYDQLVDKDSNIIKLFTPAFSKKSKTTGYVNRYPEGVRENGGQYTHGALWLAQAYFMLNDAERGYELLQILNPANKDTAQYKTEPYYLAGDVYSAKGMEGRGGWSIYTGSAGWFYRIVSEYMLGITKRGNIIKTNPRLPDELRESRVIIELNGNRKEFML